jgi:Trk K+ transport system NAD-binding subunit
MKQQVGHITFLRRMRASWRDTLLLFREFFWPLALFIIVMIGGGALYFHWSLQAGEPLSSIYEAIYTVLGLTFLSPPGGFPKDWHLQVFFFIMPILGIGLLAQGVAEFGSLFFNRRSRGKEWEMAVASTFDNHIVLIGLGHLGYQAVQNLLATNQDIVVIEQKPDADLLEEVRDQGIPIIIDNANRDATLEAAGIKKAKTILLCSQNDTINLQIALKSKAINPDINVVIRIFDHTFAHAIQTQFGFTAVSSSEIAGPAFAAAAAGVDMTRPVNISGLSLRLVRLDIYPNSKLANKNIETLEQIYDASIVLVQHEQETDLHPIGSKVLQAGDSIALLAEKDKISKIIQANG